MKRLALVMQNGNHINVYHKNLPCILKKKKKLKKETKALPFASGSTSVKEALLRYLPFEALQLLCRLWQP